VQVLVRDPVNLIITENGIQIGMTSGLIIFHATNDDVSLCKRLLSYHFQMSTEAKIYVAKREDMLHVRMSIAHMEFEITQNGQQPLTEDTKNIVNKIVTLNDLLLATIPLAPIDKICEKFDADIQYQNVGVFINIIC